MKLALALCAATSMLTGCLATTSHVHTTHRVAAPVGTTIVLSNEPVYGKPHPVHPVHPGNGHGKGHKKKHSHDSDRDGVSNRYDHDRDGDGVPNQYDRYPDDPRRS